MPFSMERMRDRYSVMMRSVEPGLMDGLKGHNFRSDRWIAIKLLLEFPDALFHAVDEGSILGDDEVWSSQARWTGRKAITFDPTVGSRSNVYWSFRMPFSMQWMRDRYSVMMRSGRARLDGRVERAITFDPTVGSRSNFYWSFRMPFSMQWMRDRYWVMIRSGGSKLDGRFERAITFNPTVGCR